MISNPNKANQYVLDPRQNNCWNFYVNPSSGTFGNATQSAIKAGYTPEYSNDITSSEWFCVKLWRLNATGIGERKLKELLEIPFRNDEGKVDVGIARIQADLAKYITSTQGKDEGYSNRTEHSGRNGEAMVIKFDSAFNPNATS